MHPITEVKDEFDDTARLMTRNLELSRQGYDVAKRMLRILDTLDTTHLNEADLKTFRMSMYKPYERRLQEAAQKILFWSDREAVEFWLNQKRNN